MVNQINYFHGDKWKLTFSNLPTIENKDMYLYDLYVKSITLPDLNLTEEISQFLGNQIRHPGTKGNIELSQLQITFKASENLLNYYNLLEWMLQIRFGKINESLSKSIRLYTIKSIDILMLDNQKRQKAKMQFTECFLLSLSSLSLNMGQSDQVEFTANFSYQEPKLIID